MATSIHDHHVLQLTVDAAGRTIRLRTTDPHASEPRVAEVVFQGVEGYTFRGDALGTILHAIEPVDAFSLYREHAVEMQRVYAESGGHAPWARSDAEAEAFLVGREIRGYVVSSSIGLTGAVWARGLSVTDS